MMNCEQCKAHLLDYAYGELPEEKAQEVSRALAGCDECQQELDRIRHVRGAFQEVMPAAEPPAMMRANILRQARLEAYAAKEAAEVSLLDRFQALISHPGFASAAAVLLVVVGVFFVLSAEDRDAPADFAAEKATLSPTGGKSVQKDFVQADAEEEEAAAPGAMAAQDKKQAKPSASLNDEEVAYKTAGAKRQERAQNTPAPILAEAKPKATPLNQSAAKGVAPQRDLDPPQKSRARLKALDDLVAEAQSPADQRAAPPAAAKAKRATPRQRAPEAPQAARGGEVWDSNQSARADSKDEKADPAPYARQEQLGNVDGDDDIAAFGGGGDAPQEATTGNMLSPGSGAPGRGVGGIGSAGTDAYNRAPSSEDDLGAYQGNVAAAEDSDKEADALDEKSQYDAAYRRYSAGDYAGATRGFDEFMKEAPRTSNYFALALHMRGKSQYAQGNYAGAAASFRRVIREYPGSERREEARYLLAESLLRQDPGNAEARQILEEQMGGGGGGVSSRAKDTHDQYFGNRPASRRPSKPTRKKAAPPSRPKESYDMESPGEVIDLE